MYAECTCRSRSRISSGNRTTRGDTNSKSIPFYAQHYTSTIRELRTTVVSSKLQSSLRVVNTVQYRTLYTITLQVLYYRCNSGIMYSVVIVLYVYSTYRYRQAQVFFSTTTTRFRMGLRAANFVVSRLQSFRINDREHNKYFNGCRRHRQYCYYYYYYIIIINIIITLQKSRPYTRLILGIILQISENSMHII